MSSSTVGTSERTRRIASPTVERCRNTLMRKRPTPAIVWPKSASLVSSNSRRLCSGMRATAAASVSAADIAGNAVGSSSPSTRTKGTLPVLRWRSLAPASTMCLSSAVTSSSVSLPVVLERLEALELLSHSSAHGEQL